MLGRLQSFVANSTPIHLSFIREQISDSILVDSDGFLDSRPLKRSGSHGSLYSSNSINDCTFDINESEEEQIEKTENCDELKEIYFDSNSLISKSKILMKLNHLRGNDFLMADYHSVGQKLNSILRLFTKQKVNFQS